MLLWDRHTPKVCYGYQWWNCVVAFWSSEEMLAVVCLVTMAMVWCDDSHRLHTQPPTAVQIREYITVRDRHPSGTPAQIPSGDLVPTSSPSKGGTQQHFHFALRNLDDAQLWEVLSEVCLEPARREAVAPLVGLPLHLGEGPGKGAHAGTDHGEVALPRGGDGDFSGRTYGPQASLEWRRMLDISSVPLPPD